MKRFLVTTFQSGAPFGLITALLGSLMAGLPVGLLVGFCAGLLFGVSLAVFTARQRRRFQADPPDFSGERLLWEGPANHFFRAESVGGWLYLTTGRLLFRSHRVNVQPHEMDLPLVEVAGASPVLTAGFVPNGLLVRTVAGGEERFVVEQRKRWATKIAEARKGLAKPDSGASGRPAGASG